MWNVRSSMSDDGHEGRVWHFYVQDMIDFAKKAVAYTEGKTRGEFVADALIYDATLRNLQLIGEAATRIPHAVREAHSEIPWRAIIGARNRLAHAYLTMNDDLIWSMIQDGIPNLLPALRNLLNTINEDTV